MKHPGTLLIVGVSLLLSTPLLAKPPIKSVDEQGNVTYSDKPAEDAVSTTVVPIEPGPAPEQVEAAQERLEKIKEEADSAAEARKKAEAERQARQEKAREKAPKPEVIIIQEDNSGYPIYTNPPLTRPPSRPRPPIFKPDHPAYRPPGSRPPTTLPIAR